MTPWRANHYPLSISSKINDIAELAAALTPVEDIAALLDINEDMLRMELATPQSPVRRAYLKARAQTALMLRKQEIELARVGSPLAVQLTGAYLRDMVSTEDL